MKQYLVEIPDGRKVLLTDDDIGPKGMGEPWIPYDMCPVPLFVDHRIGNSDQFILRQYQGCISGIIREVRDVEEKKEPAVLGDECTCCKGTGLEEDSDEGAGRGGVAFVTCSNCDGTGKRPI